MLHEKPNESFHWKNKLDELDHLPDEPVKAKSVSWEKLHDRLREKPGSKKTIWYWSAAACLLITVGILWIMPNQDPGKTVTKKTQSTPEQSVNNSEIVKEKTPTTNLTEMMPEKTKKQAIIVSLKKKNRPIVKHTATTEKDIPKDSTAAKQSSPEIIVHSSPSSDTMNPKTIATTVATKKLRVVHINEIVKPAEEMPYAKLTLQPTLQGKPISRNDLPVFSLSKNASDNLVKIKLSPSN